MTESIRADQPFALDECVLIFERSHELMAAEQCLQTLGYRLRIMPIPPTIRRGCGLALRIDPADLCGAVARLDEKALSPVGLFRREVIAGRSHYSPWEDR